MVLGIYGAGGNGKTVVDLARYINRHKKTWDRIVFIDDVTQEKNVYNTDVYPFKEAIEIFDKNEIEYVISLGEPADREMLFNRLKENGCRMGTLINPNAWLPDDLKMGEGIILGDCTVGSDTYIGDNVFVSQDAVIGHDTNIGSHGVVSAGCFIAGHCNIGNKVYVGPRSALRDRIKVEDNAIIAIGAVVFKDVPGNVIALGNPAKHIKKDDNYRIF
ncbi:MAG: acetyltransferase [Butyrivibrio sp.]|nr:acetyltransferase [Butyrivibrio sp.]